MLESETCAAQRADAGIVMGLKGSKAAKEAAEFVLADDNFADDRDTDFVGQPDNRDDARNRARFLADGGRTQPVSLPDGVLIIAFGVTFLAIIEIEKQLRLALRRS